MTASIHFMRICGVKIFKNFSSPAYSHGLQYGCWVVVYLYNILWNQYKSGRTSFSGRKSISYSSKFEVFWHFCLYSFQLKIPSAIAFLYSLSLWFNHTGHQGMNARERMAGNWRTKKKKLNVHHLVTYNSASWLWNSDRNDFQVKDKGEKENQQVTTQASVTGWDPSWASQTIQAVKTQRKCVFRTEGI